MIIRAKMPNLAPRAPGDSDADLDVLAFTDSLEGTFVLVLVVATGRLDTVLARSLRVERNEVARLAARATGAS